MGRILSECTQSENGSSERVRSSEPFLEGAALQPGNWFGDLRLDRSLKRNGGRSVLGFGQLTSASNGGKALEVLQEERPGFVLLLA